MIVKDMNQNQLEWTESHKDASPGIHKQKKENVQEFDCADIIF